MPAHLARLVLVCAGVVVALASVFAAGAAAVGRDTRTLPTVPAASTTVTTAATGGISVSGTGQAPGTPDVLRLDVGVSTTGSSATQALDRSSSAMTKVIAALRAGGVKKEDVRTSGLSLDPTYD